MWISQNIRYRPVSDPSHTTYSKPDEVYAPYGFCSYAPSGEKALIIPTNSGDAAVGYKMSVRYIMPGEVMLFSQGGAYITLKNDGSVIINGLTITPEGTIE
jgi:phage gp45-like